jgi:CheY-like chemotaxis protein
MARIQALLAPANLDLNCVVNGVEAISFVRNPSNMLDLLITDLDMPKRTGWDVINAVRQHRGESVPIIMQTGEATYPWVKDQAKQLGIVLIDKVDIDRLLLPAVKKALSLS